MYPNDIKLPGTENTNEDKIWEGSKQSGDRQKKKLHTRDQYHTVGQKSSKCCQ